MAKKYVNIVGASHYLCNGTVSPFTLGAKVTLVRESNNQHDAEAVSANMENIGIVGYVANSVKTVIMGCSSAGNVCEAIDKCIAVEGTIKFIVPGTGPVVEIDLP